MATKSMILAAAFAASGLLGAETMAQEGRRGPRPDGPPGGRHGAPEHAGAHHPGGPIFGALDADGDGTLSAGEIEGAAAALKAIDADGDGAISHEDLRDSRREVDRPDGPPRGRRGEGRGPEGSADRPSGGPRGPRPEAGPGGPPEGRGPRGDRPGAGPGPMRLGALPPFVLDRLDLTEEQREKMTKLDEEVRGRLESILTPEQFAEVHRRGPGGPPDARPGGPPEGRPDRPRRPMPPRGR